MSVIKFINNSPYTSIANIVIDLLEIDELGAFVKMIKLPPTWEFDNDSLQTRLSIGRDKLQRITKRLKEVGLLRIVPAREKGRFDGWDWELYATPIEILPDDGFSVTTQRVFSNHSTGFQESTTENQLPDDGFSGSSEYLNNRQSENTVENIKENIRRESKEEEQASLGEAAAPPKSSIEKTETPKRQTKPDEDCSVGELAVRFATKILKRSPNEPQRLEIQKQITDLERWQEILRQFALQGHPPQRVDWLLERYHGKSSNGNYNFQQISVPVVSQPTPEEVAEKERERERKIAAYHEEQRQMLEQMRERREREEFYQQVGCYPEEAVVR